MNSNTRLAKRTRSLPFLASSIASILTALAPAGSLTWDGSDLVTTGAQGGTGTWNVNSTANWWNGSADVVWPALGGLDDDAVFANTAGTVTLGSAITANDLKFSTTGYIVTGNTLTLNGTTPTITTDPAVTATINSIVAGTVGLVKAGTGTLVLGGVNTYTGGTTVSAGTLQATLGAAQSGISSGAASVASGATLQLDNTVVAGGGLTIANTFTGAGVLKLNFAANATPRNTTMNGVTGFTGNIRLSNAGATGDKWTVGGLAASTASVTIDSGSQMFVNTGTSTFSAINVQGTGNSETRGAIRLLGTLAGNITLAASTTIGTEGGIVSGTITSGAAGTQTLTFGTTNSTGNGNFNGIIGGGTGTIALTKTAAGTVVLAGANTYTGGTTVSAGTLQATLTATQSGISLSGAASVASGATLQLDNTVIVAGGLTIANTFTGAGVLKLNFAANATARNTVMNGVTGFTGNIRLSNAGANADKWNVTALNAPSASVTIDSGSQMLVSAGTSTFSGINVQGTGNSETRGAIRLIGTLAGNITLAASTTIGTEGGIISGGITSGAAGTQTLTLGTANSTGNGNFNGIIGGGTGTIDLAKTAAGTATLTAANTYTGTTTVNGGMLSLSGANGAIASSSGITIGSGTTLKLDNLSTANNVNRLGNTTPVSMTSGTLNFSNNAGLATNYSETTGALTLTSGSSTISASQAALAQTSALTLTSLTRTAGTTVNFTGTELGANTRNRILITANPAVTSGLIGLWATSNGTSLATYDATLGVKDAVHTDVTRSNSGAKVIANGAGNNVRIIEGTGVILSNLTLGSPVTTVNSIYHTASGGASPSVIDPAGQTLRLGAAAGIVSQSGAGALTVGNFVNSGVLTAGGADNTAGTLTVLNNSTSGITINSAITNNGTGPVGLFTDGVGTVTLAGSASNTYTGLTTIGGAGQLILSKIGGAVAIGGDINMSGAGVRTIVSATQNNQFAPGSIMRFTATPGDTRLELKGTTQTLGGLDSTGFAGVFAAVQHSEFGAPAAVGGTSTLVLDVSGSNTYTFGNAAGTAAIRSQGGIVALTKNGTGTQILTGPGIIYTGATVLNSGTLRLTSTNSASAVSVNPTGTLAINGVNTTAAQVITLNGGTLLTDENAGFVVNSKLLTVAASSTFQINGTGTTTNVSQWFADAGIAIGAGQTLTLNASTVNNGLVVRSGAGVSNGALIVNGAGTTSLLGRANLQFNTAGAAQFSNTDITLNNATMNIGQGANSDVNAAGATVKSLSGNGLVVSDTVARTLTVGTNNGTGNFTGVIANGSAGAQALTLIKEGTGTQTLSGTNTYTGATTIGGGTLKLDFDAGGTSDILSSSTAVTLAGGTLELKGGNGESNSQTINGLSGTGTVLLTGNGATTVNLTLGAIGLGGVINFSGSDATIGALGSANFLTTTTTSGDNGTARLGAHLWNGSNWASTSATGGNHVVQWAGTYADIFNGTNPGPVAIPSATPAAEVRILEATDTFANNTLGANETINSLLMSAGTTSATVDMGTNTLTVGNGAGAAGAIAIGSTAQSLTIGTVGNQGFLIAGNSAAASILALNNQNAASTLTINAAVKNNAALGVLSLNSDGKVVLNGTNTYTGTTTIGSGTLEIGGAGSLGGGTYAGAIANRGALRYSSSVNQTLSGVISGSGSITKAGTSLLQINGANTFTGGIVVSQGSLQTGNNAAAGTGTITLGDANTGASDVSWKFQGSGTPANNIVVSALGSGLVTLGAYSTGASTVASGSLTLNRAVTFNDATADRTSYTGKISGNVGTITISGTRITFDNPANDFVGNLVISSGAIYQNNALTALPIGTSINNAGNFRFNAAGVHAVDAVNGAGAITIIAGGNATLSLGNAGGTSNISGIISNGSNVLSLIKNGAGDLTLSAANTFTGTTRINSGTLFLTNSLALQSSTLDWDSAGTINFGSLTAVTLGALQGAQNLSLLNTTPVAIALTVGGNGGTTTYTGILSGTGSSLIKAGAGVMTLTGSTSNTYTGTTTVNAGSLALAKTGGAIAVQGDLVIDNVASGTVWTTANNEVSGTGVLSFTGNTGNARFNLVGTSQSFKGISDGATTARAQVIQNSETIGGAPLNSGLGTLNLLGGADYTFSGYLRNSTGFLAVTKSGTGTQTLSGDRITYTGDTTVTGGTLQLTNTTVFASRTINNSAAVGMRADTNNASSISSVLSGNGTWSVDGPGGGTIYQNRVILRGNGSTNTGTISVINSGKLWVDRVGNAIGDSSIVDVGATAQFYVFQGISETIGGLSGTGNVFGGDAAGTSALTVGGGNTSAAFGGILQNNLATLTFTKIGSGTQTLSGASTYTGATTVNAGTLLLDFAAGGTSNILAAGSAVALGGGTLELKGGSGEANTQTHNGISGIGKFLLTQNGATSINVTLGAIGNGSINFTGSDASVGALGTANFLTSTTTAGNNGTAILGGHLWNGSTWASTSATGGNHVVEWAGTYTDLTTDGNAANPTGDLRILDGTAAGTAATFSANTTINSLLVTAPTYASTVDVGTNTLTVGNGVSATGGIAIVSTGKSLTIGTSANQGTLTAGTSGASTLALNNLTATSDLTVNSVIANNTGAGVVSLNTGGKVVLNGTNTYTGGTNISGGTLEIGGAGKLGNGTYAGAITNAGVLRYNSSANQTISGTFSGAGTLVKDNASSKLTLNGAGVTYSGGTTINAGSVDWQNIANVAAGTMTINAGGTLTTSLAGVNSDINSFLVLNGGSITASVVGSANLGNFRINSTAGVTVGGSQRSVISADVRMGNNATTDFNVGNTGDAEGIDLDITGMFSHYHNVTWGYMSKSGLGTVRFTNTLGTNNIGTITVNAGKVILANVVQNAGNGGLTVSPGGTIDFIPGFDQSFTNALHGGGVYNKEGVSTLTFTANSDTVGTLNLNAGKIIAGGAASTGLGNVIVKAGTTLQSNGGDFFGFASNTSQITIQGGTVTTGTGGAYRNTISKLVFDGGGILTSGAGNAGDANGQYSFFNNGATTGTIRVINPGASTATINAPIFSLWGTLTGGTTFEVARGTASSDMTISSSLRSQAANTPIIKTGAGILTLSGANTFVGNTTVSEGTLIGTQSTALGALNNSLTVANGATFAYHAASIGALNMGTGVLNLAGGSRIGTSVGGTLSQSAINSTAAAVTAGAITVDVYGVSSGTSTTGTHNLITAASGLTSGGATYTLGNVYNPTNFTVNSGTFASSNSAISIGVTTATPLATAYWKGGFSGGNNVWAISNGSTASNWASDASGTDTSLVPGATAIVNFSATSATNQGAMTLGANMSIGGINVSDTNPVSLNQGGGNLTLGFSGITVNSGAGAVTLSPDIALVGSQTWANNSSNALTVAGNVTNNGSNMTVSGSGNTTITGNLGGTGALYKTGNGILTLSAANIYFYSGAINIVAGTVRAGAAARGKAFGDNSVVALANVSGATLDLNNFSQSIASIAGGGAAGGNVALGNATLSVGTNNTNTTYSGAITGTGGSFNKYGTGTQTLDGSTSNTYTGLTTVYQGAMTLAKTGGATAIGGNLTFDNNLSPDVYTTVNNQFASGTVVSFVNDITAGDHGRLDLMGTTQTVAGIQTVGYSTIRGVIQNSEAIANPGTSTLVLNGSGTYSFGGFLRSQTGVLGLTKNGTGTQTLVGSQITYTGATAVNSGTLRLAATNSASAVTVNPSGTLAINGNGTNTTAAQVITLNGGTLLTDENAGFVVNSKLLTVAASSTFQINGTGTAGNVSNWFADAGIAIGAGQTLTLNASTVNNGIVVRSGAGVSNGALIVNGAGTTSSVGRANLQFNTAGATQFSNTDITLNNATMNIGQCANTDANTAGATVKSLSGNGLVVSDTVARTLTVGTNNGTGNFTGILANGSAGAQALTLVKEGAGTQTLGGANTFTGTTTVNAGTLKLSYAAQNNSKLSDTAVLTLSGGGSIELSGGSHTETVLSTTLNAGSSFVTQSSGTGVLQMNAITRNAGAFINFGAANIATTDNTNTNGILGLWATVGTDWAVNSTNAADGLITAYTGYADVTRLESGTKAIADATASFVRIIDGTGSTPANITLAAATTNISNLNQSATGGATTIDMTGGKLRVGVAGGILAGTGVSALTIGTAVNEGTLTAGGNANDIAGDIAITNNSANAITINSVIANNGTGAVTLAKGGTGVLTLNGTNTFTGAIVNGAGTLEIGGAGQLGAGTYAGTIANSGILRYNSTAAQTLSGVISGAGSLVKDGVGSTLTLTNINTLTGGVAVNQGKLLLARDGSDGNSVLKGVVTVNAGGTLDWSATNTLGYNGGTITSLNIIGGTVGGGDFNQHLFHNAGTLPINMTGGILKLGGVSAVGTANQFRSAPITVTASANQAQILGVTGNATLAIRDATAQTFNVGDGSQAVDLLVDVIVSQNLGAGSIIKDGTGTMQLTKNNGYSGNTTINAGVLEIASGGLYRTVAGADAFNNSAVLQVNAGATLKLKSYAYNGEGGTGGLSDNRQRRVLNGGTIEVTAATHSSGNDFTVNAAGGTFRYNPAVTTDTLTMSGNGGTNIQLDGTVTFDTVGNITISDQVDGVGGVTKTGAGTLLLSALNTYTGLTTVSNGTLVVSGTLSGSATVDGATSTLASTTTGIISGSVNAINGGTVSPGGTSVGTVNSGTLTSPTGKFALDINTTALTSDLANVTGNLNLAGSSTLSITDFNPAGSPLSEGSLFTFIDYSGTWDGGGFSGYADDSVFVLGLNAFRISYNGVDNTSTAVTLEVVPEPGAVISLLSGLGVLLGLRRRRKA